MKMLTSTILLLFQFQSSAQFYEPIPDSGSVWQIDRISMGVFQPMVDLVLSSDTTINSTTYKQIIKLNDAQSFDPFATDFVAGIRSEDSLWYVIKSGETQEHLLYDFSLIQGDTISIYNPWVNLTTLQVISVDSILIQGQYRKKLNLDNYQMPGWPESWIEGIGSSFGIIYSGENIWDEGHNLMCFHENDTLTYIDSVYNDCDYTTVGLNETTFNEKEMIRVIDSMGRGTENKPNTLLIYIYSDGTTEKVFRVE